MSHNLEAVIESQRLAEKSVDIQRTFTYSEAMVLCRSGYKVKLACDKLSKVHLEFIDGKVMVQRGYGQEPTEDLNFEENQHKEWIVHSF